MENMANEYIVEALDETGGLCDCCGNASRSIWGLVHSDDRTVAAYWLHWTVGHLDEAGANLDMVIGPWGDGTTANDRFAASLLYREPANEAPALMVIDATGRKNANSTLANTALCRDEIIGSPIAEQLFALVDAIWLQDARFF